MNNNGIRLEPDVNKPEPLSIISLASDLVSIEDSKTDNRARNRPKVSNISAIKDNNKGFESIDMEGLIAAS